jgi:hypothetical protein
MFRIFLTTVCLTRIRIKTFTLVWWIRILGYQHGAQVRKGGGKSAKFKEKCYFLSIFPQLLVLETAGPDLDPGPPMK